MINRMMKRSIVPLPHTISICYPILSLTCYRKSIPTEVPITIR